MPQGMCPYIKDHSLGLPRRLRRLSGGPSLRLRHPGDTPNLRRLLLCRSALKHPLLKSIFTPQKKSPDPPRGFSGVEVCLSLWSCRFQGRGAPSYTYPPCTLSSHPSDFTWIASPWEESPISSGCCASAWQLPLMSLHDWWLQYPPFYIVKLSGCSDT